jgi:hypothetical protein
LQARHAKDWISKASPSPADRLRKYVSCPHLEHATRWSNPNKCRLGLTPGKAMRRSAPPAPNADSLAKCCRLGGPISDPIRRLSFAIRTKQDAGRKPVAWNLCNAPIYVDYFIDSSRNGRWGWALEVAMHCSDVAPSSLPSLFLPCPHCGHRMVITAVEPAVLPDGAPANDLQDVTHGCDHCGTKLTRIIRPLDSAA